MSGYQFTIQGNLQEVWEYDSSGRVLYHGQAQAGVKTSSIGWRIRKWAYTGTNFYANTINWANQNSNFEFEWDERDNYDYTPN